MPPQRSMTMSFEKYLRHIAHIEDLYSSSSSSSSSGSKSSSNSSSRSNSHHDSDVINNKISLKYLSIFYSKNEIDTISSNSWVKHSLSILTPANKELFYDNNNNNNNNKNNNNNNNTTDYRYIGIVCRFSMSFR